MASEDQDSPTEKKTETISKVKQHQENKIKYESLKKELEESDEVQISTSDPDSRQLLVRNNITEVGYNIQTTVDAKHNIPIDYKVTNKNDSKAMGTMVRRAKTILGTNDFTALYDKGYHTGSEFEYAFKHGVEVIVAAPDVASHAPDIAFDVENFQYNKECDTYTCPAGKVLKTNGSWYTKAHGKTINKIKHYKTKACLTCTSFVQCTRNKSGRLIERTEHQNLIEENKKRLNENMQTYRKRQAIVEHPFGIIKRQWDFYYILTKRTIKHATADVGFIFTAYNLRRIFNLIDKIKLKKFFLELVYFFLLCINHFKLISQIIFLSITKLNIEKFNQNSFLKNHLID